MNADNLPIAALSPVLATAAADDGRATSPDRESTRPAIASRSPG
jgi:hypothetical protein